MDPVSNLQDKDVVRVAKSGAASAEHCKQQALHSLKADTSTVTYNLFRANQITGKGSSQQLKSSQSELKLKLSFPEARRGDVRITSKFLPLLQMPKCSNLLHRVAMTI